MGRLAVRYLAAGLVAFVVVVAAGIVWAWNGYHAAGPLEAPVSLVISKGTGVQEIAEALQSAGVIDNPHLFVLGARYTDMARRMRAGEFSFASGISMRKAAEHLVSGETVKRRLTIPEGLLTEEIVALVAAADGLVGEVPEGLPDGVYLPETYFFSYGDSRLSVLGRMEAALDKALADAWSNRSGDIAIRTPVDALILASIIERETGVAEERVRVSGVFHNRLRRKMRLQSDPTVAYAVTGGGRPLDRTLTRADLNIDSPYNTYRSTGLPPGPIANPGRASLIAAVNPAKSKELYFVADGKGGHLFARTLREHNRNVAAWRRMMRKRAP